MVDGEDESTADEHGELRARSCPPRPGRRSSAPRSNGGSRWRGRGLRRRHARSRWACRAFPENLSGSAPRRTRPRPRTRWRSRRIGWPSSPTAPTSCTRDTTVSPTRSKSAGLDRVGSVHAVLFDLGVSSMQLDEADRGFAYSRTLLSTCGWIPPSGSPRPTSQHLQSRRPRENPHTYGEERFAGKIASDIVRTREKSPFRTSGELVELLYRRNSCRGAPHRRAPGQAHVPGAAVEVNGELDSLRDAIPAALDALPSADGSSSCRTSRSKTGLSSRNWLLARSRAAPRDFRWNCRGWEPSFAFSPVAPSAPRTKRSRSTHVRLPSACVLQNESPGGNR